jgi:hypothetical protein
MAMKIELEEYHRNVTNDELISDLMRVAANLQKKLRYYRRVQ